MNKLKSLKGNDYVLLLSAGASLGTLFLWGASYIFPEGEIIEGRRVFENIPKVLQYIFYVLSASTIYLSGYLFSLRVKNWIRGKEEKRNVKFSDRLWSFFDGITMRTVLRFNYSLSNRSFLGLNKKIKRRRISNTNKDYS